MLKKKIKITNPQGLHARPASLFVKIANQFESDITVRRGGEAVDGKSIMGLMTLAAHEGSVIEIQISGPDAETMMKELQQFLTTDQEPAS
ncbi:MAG: HPr family phosphocarrier protein [Candidatus Omnitrophica bacterium]|nr:HPr family phosphocarrier protein [Candidatus Omnitrophota bacterium]